MKILNILFLISLFTSASFNLIKCMEIEEIKEDEQYSRYDNGLDSEDEKEEAEYSSDSDEEETDSDKQADKFRVSRFFQGWQKAFESKVNRRNERIAHNKSKLKNFFYKAVPTVAVLWILWKLKKDDIEAFCMRYESLDKIFKFLNS